MDLIVCLLHIPSTVVALRLHLLLLKSPLAVPLDLHLNSSNLLHSLLLRGYVVIDEEILSDKNALLVDNVVELAFFFFNNVFLIFLFFIIVVILFFVVEVFLLLLLLSIICTTLHVELVENVLDLPLELLVARLHQDLKRLDHAQGLGLLPKLLSSKDGVQGTVHIGAHLEILMLNKLVKYSKKVDLWILALVFSCGSQREIHQ